LDKSNIFPNFDKIILFMNPSITIEDCESKWSAEIEKYCGILVGNKDHGWIITLGIFQDLKQKIAFLNGSHNIRAFLYQCATQRCINFLRRKNIMEHGNKNS
jgi:hypothetical protein